MKAEQIVHLWPWCTCLIQVELITHRSTGLVGAVVKLSDLRLVGTEIETRSRHTIFLSQYVLILHV